jgi:hypothetical protein
MQKLCAQCGIPFECDADSASGCWCKSVTAWQGVRASLCEKYSDCVCKGCLSYAFLYPSTLKRA